MTKEELARAIEKSNGCRKNYQREKKPRRRNPEEEIQKKKSRRRNPEEEIQKKKSRRRNPEEETQKKKSRRRNPESLHPYRIPQYSLFESPAPPSRLIRRKDQRPPGDSLCGFFMW